MAPVLARLLASLQAQGASTRGIHVLLRKFSRLADGLLTTLWQRAGLPPGLTLAAVGGFGREQLFPHSDIDVLVLLPDEASPDSDAPLKAQLEHLIGLCWDCGLDIGSSVRKVTECVEEASRDVTVQTSMVECRLIAGSRSQFNRLVSALAEAMNPKAFFVAKTLTPGIACSQPSFTAVISARTFQ